MHRGMMGSGFQADPKNLQHISRESSAMYQTSLSAAGALALLLTGAVGASAGGVATMAKGLKGDGAGTIVHQVHSLYEAKHKLADRGYYDIRIERASLPYSFNACKRGVRFHIHVNFYGDFVQVDEVGPCRRYEYYSGYYGYRSYAERPYRRYRYPRYDY